MEKLKEKLGKTKFSEKDYGEDLLTKEPEEIRRRVSEKFSRLAEEEREAEYLNEDQSKIDGRLTMIALTLTTLVTSMVYLLVRVKGEKREDKRQANILKKDLNKQVEKWSTASNELQDRILRVFGSKIVERSGSQSIKISDARNISPLAKQILLEFKSDIFSEKDDSQIQN